jgi:Family of unknown function (DUF5670)
VAAAPVTAADEYDGAVGLKKALGARLSACGPNVGRRTRQGAWEVSMLMTIGIILLILWALGFLAFHVSTSLIHILIVLAVIAIVMHLVRGSRLTS